MLLSIKKLKKYFPIKQGVLSRTVGNVKAVDGISLTLGKNEVLGLVGESGCGKSTAGKSILRLIKPTAGEIQFDGIDINAVSRKSMKKIRKKMQIIFQDPLSSLNPRMSIGSIIQEPLDIHNIGERSKRQKRVAELMNLVGLSKNFINRYPHEFSGGQCQRIGIARALALNPKMVIADEPVSALDVSVQAQIINLLIDLKNEFGLSYIFISHDLSVVQHISDRIAVMYLGKIVESGTADQICDNPQHPYTKALLSVVPKPQVDKNRMRTLLQGDVPSPSNPPSGCHFHTRCPIAVDSCKQDTPQLDQRDDGRLVRCPFA